MFVALKDIVHAKGRFTLMIGVIALLTLLLVLLTGLTRGLAHQNISAIADPAPRHRLCGMVPADPKDERRVVLSDDAVSGGARRACP